MKKTILLFSSLFLMAGSAMAEGFLNHTYLVAKAGSLQSGSYEHEGATITGEAGTAFAFDLGYNIDEHIAAELTFGQGANNVEEHHITGEAKYTMTGILGVYLYHVSEELSLVGKLGYMSESETVTFEGHSASQSNGGAVVVVAGEYGLGGHNEIVLEYEQAFIEGPKGGTIYIGWKHGFE